MPVARSRSSIAASSFGSPSERADRLTSSRRSCPAALCSAIRSIAWPATQASMPPIIPKRSAT